MSDQSKQLIALGKWLKISRKRRSISQQEAAKLIGIHRDTLRRIEDGEPGTKISLILATAGLYGRANDMIDSLCPKKDVEALTIELSAHD